MNGPATWKVLMEENATYTPEQTVCRERMDAVGWERWKFPALVEVARELCCESCGSGLLQPVDTEVEFPYDLALRCSGCGETSNRRGGLQRGLRRRELCVDQGRW